MGACAFSWLPIKPEVVAFQLLLVQWRLKAEVGTCAFCLPLKPGMKCRPDMTFAVDWALSNNDLSVWYEVDVYK